MRRLAFLLLAAFVCCFAGAQIRGNNVEVVVVPDHADWTYAVDDKAKLTVSVLRSGVALDGAVVDIEAGPVMFPDVKRSGLILKKGMMDYTATMKAPGFYRLKVRTTVDGHRYEGLCTVGFSPEKIVPATKCPADFDAFWNKTLADARATELNPTRVLLSERCTDKVNVYEVSFNNLFSGSRTYGILCVPKAPGRYPALLRVPGAGVRPYPGDVWTASQGAVTLEIGIHGVPVTMSQTVYDNLASGALNGYWDCNIGERARNYYKRVIVGAVRSVDYIATLPEWNGECLGVTGSSQGGFLSLAVAALDKRVTFLGVVHDAMCDYESALGGKADGWPHYFYGRKNVPAGEVENARYYDGVNFARRVNVPGWYSFGYNDEIVPPNSSYGTYNIVTAKKTLSVYPRTGHYWYQEQWDEWMDFIFKQMNIK